MRRDSGLLRVPQDLAKQPVLGDGLPGGLWLPEGDKQRHLHWRLPGPSLRLPAWMAGQPVDQGGGRLLGEPHDPTIAPGHAELVGRPAVAAPEDIAELQGAHFAGTQADVTQQSHNDLVAHPGRGLRVGYAQQPLILFGRDGLRRGCLPPGGVQVGGQLGAAGVADKLTQGAAFEPQRRRR